VVASEVEERRRADHVLAQRCVAQERSAQLQLFREHRERVHLILYRVVGGNEEMEDLVQDAFIEIFRSLRLYRGDSQLGTWIDRITTRLVMRHVAHRKPRALPLPRLELVHDGPSADARVAARQQARKVYALIDALEAEQRVALTLHAIDGRPLREVASMMGASLVATKVRVWRARRSLEARALTDPDLAELVMGTGAAAE
jgi:RNA polymerase sigma factor (sigma-70 family)